MRRIAIFSDIHGNILALDAVLADIAASGITERYCLGDLVGYGAKPGAVIERIRSLGIPTVRGNYDDGVGKRLGGCGCYYDSEIAEQDGRASYEFTDLVLSRTDHEWLASLPGSIRLPHPGVRVLLTHGSPRKLNEYLLLDRTDAQLARLAAEAEADVVCVGHVHMPYHRVVAPGVHYVNAGSVGKPKDGDPRAAWVELLFGSAEEIREAAAEDDAAAPAGPGDVWLAAVAHRVGYDVEAAADAVVAAGLPQRLADALRTA